MKFKSLTCLKDMNTNSLLLLVVLVALGEPIATRRSDWVGRPTHNDLAPLPKEVDWRQVPNRVGPVRKQASSRAGAHFTVAGLLEGQQVARNFTKELIPVSVQQMIDCTPQGGDAELVLLETYYIGGVMAERDYKYVDPAESWCRFQKSKSVMSISGYELPNISQKDFLERWVANYGPIGTSVTVDEEFRNYKSGVFSSTSCDDGNEEQPILIVGYGTDPNQGDYWILKNSWGSDWGEGGYMRIKRGENMCFVEQAVYRAAF